MGMPADVYRSPGEMELADNMFGLSDNQTHWLPFRIPIPPFCLRSVTRGHLQPGGEVVAEHCHLATVRRPAGHGTLAFV